MLSNLASLPQSVLTVLFVLLGLMVGSFLNVIILRLPKRTFWEWTEQCKTWLKEKPVLAKAEQSDPPPGIIVKPSHCPNCKTPLKAWHNIPIISYLFLRGKCSNCKEKISFRYPMIEALTAIASGVVFWKFGLSLETVFALVLTWSLIVHSFIDFDHQLLLDEITYPILWLGLLGSLILSFTDPTSAIIGAVAGYIILWSIFHLFKILTGKEGMGYGDFKLLALLGAWLGWQFIPQIILLSTIAGSVFGIALILFKKQDKEKPIPFGPYLAIAGWIALIWGDKINQNYFQFL
jgi:leader peptidase (prepilin peptidase)/N-methyltransferase